MVPCSCRHSEIDGRKVFKRTANDEPSVATLKRFVADATSKRFGADACRSVSTTSDVRTWCRSHVMKQYERSGP